MSPSPIWGSSFYQPNLFCIFKLKDDYSWNSDSRLLKHPRIFQDTKYNALPFSCFKILKQGSMTSVYILYNSWRYYFTNISQIYGVHRASAKQSSVDERTEAPEMEQLVQGHAGRSCLH